MYFFIIALCASIFFRTCAMEQPLQQSITLLKANIDNSGLRLESKHTFPMIEKSSVDDLKKAIKNNSKELLWKNFEFRDNKIYKKYNQNEFFNNIQENPLQLFTECIGDECCLNRILYPFRRQFYESQIIHHIEKHFSYFKETNRPITITSFACGHLFSEARILTYLLENNIRVHLNLIDLCYTEYIEHIKSNDCYEIPFNFKQKRHTVTTARLAALLHWSKQCCADGISLNLYANAQAYQSACKNNDTLKSDVLIGTDVEKGQQDFESLSNTLNQDALRFFALNHSQSHDPQFTITAQQKVNTKFDTIFKFTDKEFANHKPEWLMLRQAFCKARKALCIIGLGIFGLGYLCWQVTKKATETYLYN